MLNKNWLIKVDAKTEPYALNYIKGIDAEFSRLKTDEEVNKFLGQQKLLAEKVQELVTHIVLLKNAEKDEIKRYAMKESIQLGRDLEKKITIMIIKARQKLKVFSDDDNELTKYVHSKAHFDKTQAELKEKEDKKKK